MNSVHTRFWNLNTFLFGACYMLDMLDASWSYFLQELFKTLMCMGLTYLEVGLWASVFEGFTSNPDAGWGSILV